MKPSFLCAVLLLALFVCAPVLASTGSVCRLEFSLSNENLARLYEDSLHLLDQELKRIETELLEETEAYRVNNLQIEKNYYLEQVREIRKELERDPVQRESIPILSIETNA